MSLEYLFPLIFYLSGDKTYQPALVKLNTAFVLSFMIIKHTKSTANLKLIDNLILLPDTPSMVSCAGLSWLENEETSGLKQRLIVWVLSVTDWLVSKRRHSNFNSS